MRASEMSCEAIFKGTQVDGVYNKDPKKFEDAVRYDKVSYDEVLQKNLKVMDASICRYSCFRWMSPADSLVYSAAKVDILKSETDRNGSSAQLN